MNPALSIVCFTVLAGSAQGLAVVLALASLSSQPPATSFLLTGLAVAELLLVLSLLCSFLHLGHKLRAWRAVLMWRTSWMSREVIVMPAFIALVGLWWLALWSAGGQGVLWPSAVIAVALALWWCTAMIYACLRFVQEWAHPLTVLNYTAIGLSSGLVLAGALGVLFGEPALARAWLPWALVVTALAGVLRAVSLWRNAGLRPTSSLQSATGLKAARVVQKSMGLTGASFNTREFFHGKRPGTLRQVKWLFLLLGFVVPLLLLGLAGARWDAVWLLALPLQFAGLLAERWFFFAEARHPQNLYYQVVS